MQSIITKERRVPIGPAFAVVVTLSTPIAITAQAPERATPAAAQTLDEVAARVVSGRWDTFSTDITVRRHLVRADGEAIGPAPTAERFRWQRTKTPAGWKTTTTRTQTPQTTVRSRNGSMTLDPPPTVARIEDAEDGSPIRVWNSSGVEMPPPSSSLRERVGVTGPSPLDGAPVAVSTGADARARGRDWIEGFVMAPTARGRRKSAFERELGRPVTSASGVNHYKRREGDVEREWLVDDSEGVLLEANVVEKGKLVDHTRFSYDRAASGALVKRGLRLERLVLPTDGTRAVIEIEYSNLQLVSEGGR